MKEISLNEFKVHLAKLLAEAVSDGGLVITRYGKPYVKIMPHYSLEDDPNVTVGKNVDKPMIQPLEDHDIDCDELLKILREDRDS